MGRPRKYGQLLMDTDLRVPLTREQKALIDDAAADEPAGKAEWARAVLIGAANRKIARRKKQQAEPGAASGVHAATRRQKR